MRTRNRLAVGLAVALLGGIFPAAAAGPPEPGAMRHEAEKLMQQAEHLPAALRHLAVAQLPTIETIKKDRGWVRGKALKKQSV